MELKIIQQAKDSIIFELIGADHTLANILKERISLQKDVDACSYNVEHPLISPPKFFVSAKDVKKAISDAIDSLKKDLASLKKDAESF